MALKTPISILQELTVSRNELVPIYSFESVGDLINPRFSCAVKTSSVTAIAYARTKKDAKQKAAENALSQLGLSYPNSSATSQHRETAEAPPEDYTEGINYIGKLNEYAQTHNFLMAVNYEDSILIKTGQCQVKCIIGDLETFGYASNKKKAKQIAASEMLRLLESTNFKPFTQSTKYKSSEEVDSKALKKFEELSVSGSSIVRNNSKEVAASPDIKKKYYTHAEAKDKLEKLNLIYKIETIQKKPYIVVVEIVDKQITAMGKGEIEESATVNALNKVLEILSVGCSFT